ncbi:MAG: type II toxin-antitoxin system RelE/ParE family toxin [Bacteroidetes bacterium]|nr:type II toxin-antitoxin system RelE/ParE family toxin [Bacteroidota bacterium]
MKRKIIFFRHYFLDFYTSLDEKEQEKVEYVLDIVRNLQWIPKKFLKHIEGTDGLFEIRVSYGQNEFRIFCFFDSGMLVILLTGFKKKSQKTPGKEIDRAVKLMKEYYLEKIK